jgi:D-alanine-D-alanine ligase
MRRRGHPVTLLEIRGNHLEESLSRFDPAEVVVFNWCEGIPGEDGSEAEVVDVLDRLGFTYTGATAESIRFSYDKPRVRELLAAHGVPVPRWQVLDSPERSSWDLFPAIVKPAFEHCSTGVDRWAVVLDPDELHRRAAHVLSTYDQPAMVEDFIDGREFHVSMWGNGRVSMLPPAEMDFSAFSDVHDRLCTYDAKFSPGSVHYEGIRTVIPSSLSEVELAQLESVCMSAYRAIGCRDYGRIDIRLRDGVFYVLDINPNPDISEDASMASAAGHAGYSYGEMAERLINLASRRHPVFGKGAHHDAH